MSRAEVPRDEFNDNLCKVISAATAARGYRCADLQRATGFNYSHINRILRGVRTVTVTELVALADALDIGVSELVMRARRPEDWEGKPFFWQRG